MGADAKSPPAPRGDLTSEQLSGCARWLRRRRGFGLRRIAGGRWAVAAAIILALASCDGVSQRAERIVSDLRDPLPMPVVDAPIDTTPRAGPGRTVAAVPTNRPVDDPGPEIVIRRHDDGEAPAAPKGEVSGGTAPRRPGDITLNFAGADIRDVASSVLGDMLKLNYVIDPEVKGPINFNVSRPLARDELLPTFEAVLNSRGATMTNVNGIVRVTMMRPDTKATPAVAGAIPAPRSPADRTEAFPLRYVGATDMQHVLEKVLPQGQVVIADDKRHLVLVQGGPRELQIAEDTVRIFDIDQLNGMSMALVPLRTAQPVAVSDELKNIFASRREADGDPIRFMAVDRLNAVMVLSRSNQYLDEARAWIQRLDRSRNLNERRVYVYNLQYAKAAQVGQKLQGLLSNLDIQFKASGQPAGGDGLGIDKNPDAKPNGAKPGSPAVEQVSAVSTSVATPAVAGSPPPRPGDPANDTGVRIEADESHNALMISASARDYELIRQVLEGVDVPPLQVLIEVTVAEVSLNDQLNYGVEYFFNSGRTNTLLTTANSVGITPPVPGFALSWISGNGTPRAILDALSAVTQTKVISTPRLLVLSNETARLQVGDVVPIITQSATSTVTSSPLVVNNVTYKETGVVLEVTPRVNAGGFVTMDVNQSVSNVVNTTTSNIDSPTIQQRRLSSTVSVKTGQTILLGGLIQQNDNRSNSGIPVLGDLPGIGSLFATRNNSAGRTELIVLMTPRVIANDAQARAVTGRMEQQFQNVLDTSTMVPPRLPPQR